MARLVVVSNRVTLPRERAAQAGGLAAGLRDALARRGGVWFGWSGRLADDDAEPEVEIVERGAITYATMDLRRKDHHDYYVNYSNGSLWPLLHYRAGLLDYHREAFAGYLRVNARFAAAIEPLLRPDDLVWVHDYHLIPLAAALRNLGVTNRIGFFLHTPFPPGAVMEVLPDHDQLLPGLFAYDLVGFQTEHDVGGFHDYVRSGNLGVVADGVVTVANHRIRVGAFPIGIDADHWAQLAMRGERLVETQRMRQSLGDRQLLIGVDRLDYSKGLIHRFDAMKMLLKAWPQYCRHVTFLQIAVPSRGEVPQYRALRRELEQLAGGINGMFAEFDWAPIRYINKAFPQQTLAAFYRMARVGVVTPLRDGMNLVAKEFVAAQNPEDPGVLILSVFAGAARELDGALLINPIDRDAIAEALNTALTMPFGERRDRHRAMMETLRRNTLDAWRDTYLDALAHAPDGAPPPA